MAPLLPHPPWHPFSLTPHGTPPSTPVAPLPGTLKVCTTANFLVRYAKKETNGDMKEGQEEACELSASNYGRDEWWLLLDPVPVEE